MPLVRPFLRRFLVLEILIVGFLVADFALPFFFLSYGFNLQGGFRSVLSALLLGCSIGQINLIAAWAALAQGNLVVRLPWSATLGALIWYAMILGNRVQDAWVAFSVDEAILLGLYLLAGLVAAQAPLWIARAISGWHWVDRDSPPLPAADRRLQFNLEHMLLATVFLSIALAPVNLFVPPGALYTLDVGGKDLVSFAVVAVGSLLLAVPSIWGSQRPRSRLVVLVILGPLYCGLITAAEVGTLAAYYYFVQHGSLGKVLDFGTFFYVSNLSQCATVFGTLLLVRAMGFQLVKSPPRRGDAETQ
jgi:hypothetical protein